MNEPLNLQNIWAITDKPTIDLITKKYHQAPSTIITNDSGDDNSDLESLDSSFGPFAAVPKEFRPSPSIRKKIERPQMSLNENKQALSSKKPISVSKNTAEKTIPKNPLLENPKPATVKCLHSVANQNGTQNSKKKVNIPNPPKNPQKSHQIADVMSTAQKNTDVKKHPRGNGKTFQPPEKIINYSFQKQDKVLPAKEPKHENGVKYEYIKRQGTIQLNFEMPPTTDLFSNDGLKMASKKVIGNTGKQETRKKGYAVSFRENKVKWVSSLNLNKRNNNLEDKIEQDFGKVTHKVSYERNTLKWDSSINLKDSNNDTMGKIGQDFNKKEQRGLHQENAIKWDSSLNHKDSSSDTEGEIEWTIIQEKKTIISTKNIDGKKHIHKQINYERFPPKHYERNDFEKSKKCHRKKNFNRYPKQSNVHHRKNAAKPNQKDPENSVCKNDLQLNSNLKGNHADIQNSNIQKESRLDTEMFARQLKCNHADIQNSNTQKESRLDTEMFTRQCEIKEQNIKKMSPSLPNNKPNSYPVNIDNIALKQLEMFTRQCEMKEENIKKMPPSLSNKKPDSYPEKIDNIALKLLEDQKQSVLDYGREMADLIIGSHTTLSLFISTFREWKRSRLELISHFEYLEKNLKESSKKFTRYRDMLNFAKTGASLAAAVPLPHVSIAARVISVLTGLFSVFLSTTEKTTAEVEDSNEISIAAIRDTSASCELYSYGLQCGLQFEETVKQIEDFHSNAPDPVIFENESPEIAAFIRGVLEYKPTHRIFYKKLYKCFQELIRNCRSEFSKRFCEPFLFYSADMIDIVEFLNWQFRHEDFNGESVRFELQEIERLLGSNETSVKELTTRIQNCIGYMQDELKFLERCVKDLNLFDKSSLKDVL